MTHQKRSFTRNKQLKEGVYAATLTPLNDDLSCNSLELATHCLHLTQRGCQGVVLFGTTGEGASFSVEERLEALKQVVEHGLDPQKIILANGGANFVETIALAKAALSLDVSTLLITPPSFSKNVSEEGVIAFYRIIIQRIDHPNLRILLYHIPQYSGIPITLKVIETLRLEFPGTVIGIKESEGNLAFTQSIIKNFPGFQVFVGHEKQIIEAVLRGATGSICGVANLYPELICSLYEQGKQSLVENPKELEIFFQALQGYPFIAAFKAVMEHSKGKTWHWLRPPLLPLNPTQNKEFLVLTRLAHYLA